MRLTFRHVCFLALCYSTLLISCAKTGQLTGGGPDEDAPVLDTEKSTPNFQTNFTDRTITLEFDEFIQLKNLDKNLLISPPMFDLPDVKQRGKKITITIDKNEELREDATYAISLGDAIVDFNEGNVLEGFRFVFATGDKLDSLSMSGQIIDAYSEEPVEGAYIMLYDILDDSIVAEERPFYLVKTDASGNFKLENLKSDTFKIVALQDQNFNYTYDQISEGFGFLDTAYILTDSSNFTPKIRLSYAKRPGRLVTKNYRDFGLIYHLYDQPIAIKDVKTIYPADWNSSISVKEDTLRIRYTQEIDSVAFVVEEDTIGVNLPAKDTIFLNKAIIGRLEAERIAPWDSIAIDFNSPLQNADTALISMYTLKQKIEPIDSSLLGSDSLSLDSLVLDSLSIDSLVLDSLVLDSTSVLGDTLATDTLGVNSKEIRRTGKGGIPRLDTMPEVPIVYDTTFVPFDLIEGETGVQLLSLWTEGETYRIDFLPGSVTDVFERTNDSLSYEVTVADSSAYGNIIVNISELIDSIDYVLELHDKTKKIESYKISGLEKDSTVFSQLPMGEYNLLLIEDLDNNGEWSPVDFWENKQPEIIKRFTLDKMQPNFDVEANISWVDKKVEPETPVSEESEQNAKEPKPDKQNRPGKRKK